MKKNEWIAILIGLVLIAAAFWWFSKNNSGSQPVTVVTTPTSTVVEPTFDQSISDGVITMHFPGADFGLATTQKQITVVSNIPPCDEGFNYCLYYIGTTYKGTNFESAGIRIQKRSGLTTQTGCLTTQPTGYSNLTPTTSTSADYAVSEFPNVGGAAAGSFSSGSLYRLFYNGACYEFETRIGQSDFGNYPPGAIQQFTTDDQTALRSVMGEILKTLTLPSGESVSFPQG